MRELQYAQLGETLYEQELANGLRVFILPKEGFQQTYACFTTRYGSIDREFTVPGENTMRTVPDGIAHFLEHKMFEEEHGDVFMDFARYGAQANAFTTFDATTYLFSCTSHVNENLQILLDFVQRPYFTDENVEKEKGIIGQEIRMYDDNPNWRVYFGLLQAMYGEHPAGLDIAGTAESIAKITKEDLYDCYRTFYHPSNMVLFVVGAVSPDSIMDLVIQNQTGKKYQRQSPIKRHIPPIPERPVTKVLKANLAVSQPRTLFGYREVNIPTDTPLRQKHEAAMEIWMDCLLGKSSALYQAVIDEGLADAGFSMDYELTAWYGHSMIGGNSNVPDKLVKRVKQALEEASQTGVDKADFVRTKKKAIGRFLGLLDSPQGIANVYASQRLRGVDLFDSLRILEEITLDEVNEALKRHVQEEQFCISEVRPLS